MLLVIKKQRLSQSKEKSISEYLQDEFLLLTFTPPRKTKKQSDVTPNSVYTKMYKEMKQKMYAINRNANKPKGCSYPKASRSYRELNKGNKGV